MKTGSKSLLIGVHQFIWHPITVWLAWRNLYGRRPTWREAVCIVIHDWGYWGCPNMDGFEGERHPYFAAQIAGRLFGPNFHDLVLFHSRHLCAKLGAKPSKLCWADKISMIYDPTPWYLFRARLSGELKEYRRNAHNAGFIPAGAPDREWHEKLVEKLRTMSTEKAAEFARAEWIEAVAAEFARELDMKNVLPYHREMAASLAETCYDDPEDRMSPADAVEMELSYWTE